MKVLGSPGNQLQLIAKFDTSKFHVEFFLPSGACAMGSPSAARRCLEVGEDEIGGSTMGCDDDGTLVTPGRAPPFPSKS